MAVYRSWWTEVDKIHNIYSIPGSLARIYVHIYKIGHFEQVFFTITCFPRLQKSIKDPNVQIPVPITFIMKGMNTIFGSHFDHYWIDYGYFSDEKPDPSVFQITSKDFQTVNNINFVLKSFLTQGTNILCRYAMPIVPWTWYRSRLHLQSNSRICWRIW